MFQIRLRPWFALLLLSPVLRGESADDALRRATTNVQAATLRAQADPAHPIFHVTSPAQWMNDPNGPIFYKGVYHLFYQLTPDSDRSGIKYWGHVRSRDLVQWEHLPIALAPSQDLGEESIWSGCCTVNGEGRPMIFYTSIAPGKPAFAHAEQWAATGDEDLIHWQKSPANPVLTEALHGGNKIYDWRDPFIFHEGQQTFLVAGGHLAKDGEAAVNIYEAENPALTQWKYRGVLFAPPGAPTAECPNFFKLGKEWVLLVSPYGKVQYYLGSFDATTCRFTARTNGLLDSGSSFYAPNTMLVPDGRRLVWGWVNGFPDGRGWNGCLSLPRQLSLTHDGRLQQMPAPQLKKLRGKAIEWRNVALTGEAAVFVLPATNTLELAVAVDLKSAQAVELAVSSGTEAKAIAVGFEGAQLRVQDAIAPLSLPPGAKRLELRIFIDRSVLEVFANNTVCLTKTIKPLVAEASLFIRASGGSAEAETVAAWPLKGIWTKPLP